MIVSVKDILIFLVKINWNPLLFHHLSSTHQLKIEVLCFGTDLPTYSPMRPKPIN